MELDRHVVDAVLDYILQGQQTSGHLFPLAAESYEIPTTT